MAQELLIEYIPLYGEHLGQRINYYSENEMRYEPNQELSWLADFIVNGLVLLKHDLAMDNDEKIADVLKCLWDTLDFRNFED